ncbi:MAG TPA: hypothetical protein VF037_08640 [Gemmatimonadales bacterium]
MPAMRNPTLAALALSLAIGVAACGDDEVGPGEWTIDDLQGTWTITQLEYTADDDPEETFDVIDEGTTGTIVINGNGNYTLTLRAPGPITSTTTGTFTIDEEGNVVDSNEAGTLNITRSGDTITIRDESVTFDFDDDPETADEQADLVMVWEKD